jgi:glutathione synthase/RimK-type ligase-like ATP-grasp enzyme
VGGLGAARFIFFYRSRTMPDFTFISYRDLPALDPDDRLAADILEDRGFSVCAAVWDDPAVDWRTRGVCVLRSTWDYHLRYPQFMQWAESVAAATQLYNPIALVRWNSHKSYLKDLNERGVPIVPTRWLRQGERVDIARLLSQMGRNRAVAKPAVGLATYGVKLVDASPASQAYVNELVQGSDVMVQPYQASVDTYGERALVFIGGTYSHAARKTAFQALAPAGHAGETPIEATGPEIAVAVAAMNALPEPALYARVDLVTDDAGQPVVIEMELVEPTLFLGMHPRAATRFADALAPLARRRS